MSLINDVVSVAKDAAGEVASDAWITVRVKTRLAGNALLKDSDIAVDTSEHVVTLTGTTASVDATMRAAKIARGTRGVERIVNHLSVKTA